MTNRRYLQFMPDGILRRATYRATYAARHVVFVVGDRLFGHKPNRYHWPKSVKALVRGLNSLNDWAIFSQWDA